MIENFEKARELLLNVARLESSLQEDEAHYAQNKAILEQADIVAVARQVGETVARYFDAIKIYNALTAAINATHLHFEQMRKPPYIKITDDKSLLYDLEDLTNNIPLLAAIKAAKDAGEDEIGNIVDHLLAALQIKLNPK